jgi:hypothetical protein
MKRSRWVLIVAGLAVAGAGVAAPQPASAQISAGVVVDRDGLRHLHLAIGHYWGVPMETVYRYHPSWILPEELPVVYMLAHHGRVSPEVILALRHQGWSWLDITYHLRLDPAIFVAHLGPPYGVAHGYWRKPSRSQLRRLSDRHIIDYVNVYFWAGYTRRPVREIIVIRERVPSWTHYVRVEAPRVQVRNPGRAVAPPVQAQPRPAQPRAVTSAPAAAPAPSRNAAPAPQAGRSPAVNAPGARAPAPSAAPGRATQAAPPSANRAPAPTANRAPAPAANRAPTPAPSANRAPAPAANRAPAPSANRAPAPTANRAPAPAANRAPAPTANRAPAPAANRAPAPTANRAPAPAANRAPAPTANRNSPPAASRPPASGGGGNPPARSQGQNNGRGNGGGR